METYSIADESKKVLWNGIIDNPKQKNLPAEGDEFERSLRRHARKWKKAKLENPERRTKRKPTAKAKWTTIRLV